MTPGTIEYYAQIGEQMLAADAAYARGERPSTTVKLQTGALFTPDECRLLVECISKYQGRTGLVTSIDGTPVVDAARYAANETFFDPTSPDFDWLMQRLGPHIAEATQQFGLSDLMLVEAARMVVYSKGGHFNWHPDSSAQVRRRLTLSLQLTPEASYSGGDLILLGKGNEWACADRTHGGACLFPAELLHRATPIVDGQRAALIMWFY